LRSGDEKLKQILMFAEIAKVDVSLVNQSEGERPEERAARLHCIRCGERTELGFGKTFEEDELLFSLMFNFVDKHNHPERETKEEVKGELRE
jgi:hypothetical protein